MNSNNKNDRDSPNIFATILAAVFTGVSALCAIYSVSVMNKQYDLVEKSNLIAENANSISIQLVQLTDKSNAIAEKANSLSVKYSEQTIKFENLQLEESLKYAALTAETQWASVVGKYNAVNRKVTDFEKINNFNEKEGPVISSLVDLEKYLKNLKIPDEIIKDYFIRQDLFQTLQKMAEIYKPFQNRFTTLLFQLPSSPKFPGSTTFKAGPGSSKQSGSGSMSFK